MTFELFELVAQDKLVVNGCDLVNRDELSASQNRELQRYIDANAHLLGFLDKEKDEAEAEGRGRAVIAVGQQHSPAASQSSASIAVAQHSPPSATAPASRPLSASLYSPRAPSAASARAGSPYSLGGGSEYGTGGKRKGVSWSDVVEEPSPTRHRSNSPPPAALRYLSASVGDRYFTV